MLIIEIHVAHFTISKILSLFNVFSYQFLSHFYRKTSIVHHPVAIHIHQMMLFIDLRNHTDEKKPPQMSLQQSCSIQQAARIAIYWLI